MSIILVTSNRAALVDLSDDLGPSDFLNKLKRSAKKAVPRFRPFKMANGQEWFVVYADKREFDLFKNDPRITDANKADESRELSEFSIEARRDFVLEGDLLWNGMVIRERDCSLSIEAAAIEAVAA